MRGGIENGHTTGLVGGRDLVRVDQRLTVDGVREVLDAVVANALRLLKLAPEIQAYVRDGRLSVGHAKVILGLTRAEEQTLAAERILKQLLNVRQTEDLVARFQNRPATSQRTKPSALPMKDSHVAALEQRLQERLGTKVDLRYRQGKGAVQIHFYSDDDLERVLEILGVKLD